MVNTAIPKGTPCRMPARRRLRGERSGITSAATLARPSSCEPGRAVAEAVAVTSIKTASHNYCEWWYEWLRVGAGPAGDWVPAGAGRVAGDPARPLRATDQQQRQLAAAGRKERGCSVAAMAIPLRARCSHLIDNSRAGKVTTNCESGCHIRGPAAVIRK